MMPVSGYNNGYRTCYPGQCFTAIRGRSTINASGFISMSCVPGRVIFHRCAVLFPGLSEGCLTPGITIPSAIQGRMGMVDIQYQFTQFKRDITTHYFLYLEISHFCDLTFFCYGWFFFWLVSCRTFCVSIRQS